MLGTFADPGEVPAVAVECVAGQLEITDRSCLVVYAAREKTRLEHEWEIARVYGLRDFASAQAELTRWIDDRAWTTGDGPKALFDGAVLWLRERLVLLPGVSILARLIARVRDAAMQRLWGVLAGMLTPTQARILEHCWRFPRVRAGQILSGCARARRPRRGKAWSAPLTVSPNDGRWGHFNVPHRGHCKLPFSTGS